MAAGLGDLVEFSENLSDRRAADAVRSRIDWKHLLGLPLSDPGFDASVPSEFRSRLVQGGAETLLLDRLLGLCREQGSWPDTGGSGPTPLMSWVPCGR